MSIDSRQDKETKQTPKHCYGSLRKGLLKLAIKDSRRTNYQYVLK